MTCFQYILSFLHDWSLIRLLSARGFFLSRNALILENLALRSQLVLFDQQILAHKRPKPMPNPAFRQLWVFLSQCWTDWESALMIVKPETVIRWHRTAFRWYWGIKSKPRGRPVVSRAAIALIRRIHKENPLWSAQRIHDQMVSLGMIDIPCPNTIAKYIPAIRKPPSEKAQQSWKTFISNHMLDTWSMDFFTVPTITFRVLYVFVVINHSRRQIIHIAVTRRPTMAWTVQQLREAMPFGEQPKYLIIPNVSSPPIYRFGETTYRDYREGTCRSDLKCARVPSQKGLDRACRNSVFPGTQTCRNGVAAANLGQNSGQNG